MSRATAGPNRFQRGAVHPRTVGGINRYVIAVRSQGELVAITEQTDSGMVFYLSYKTLTRARAVLPWVHACIPHAVVFDKTPTVRHRQ